MSRDSNHTSGNNPTRVANDVAPQTSKRHSYPFTLLDRYEVQAPIGSGGMGDVALARDLNLGRQVAIKWIRGELAQSQGAVQRFYQEAKAAAALNHTNIVQIYDRGSDDGDDFFVMEYVDGESLAERLKRGPMDLDECVRIAMAVCDALQAAHDNGIVHRDVKPANIVLTADGNPKLTDFGVARLGSDSEMTMAGATVGTLAYMAPEQEKDAGGAVPKSDQYSFAATLYHMLTGESPARILERRIPDVLRDLIVRGTEPEPAQRFPTIADFKLAMCDATGVSATSVSAQHATGNALDTLKRQKDRVRQVHDAARRLAYQEHDWILARTTLQQIPETVRDSQLWNDICQKAEQVESLNDSIHRAVEQMQWKGLNLAIDALLKLQPHRNDIAQLKSVLDPADVIDPIHGLTDISPSAFQQLAALHTGVPGLTEKANDAALVARVEQILATPEKDWKEDMLAVLSRYAIANQDGPHFERVRRRYAQISNVCLSELRSYWQSKIPVKGKTRGFTFRHLSNLADELANMEGLLLLTASRPRWRAVIISWFFCAVCWIMIIIADATRSGPYHGEGVGLVQLTCISLFVAIGYSCSRAILGKQYKLGLNRIYHQYPLLVVSQPPKTDFRWWNATCELPD